MGDMYSCNSRINKWQNIRVKPETKMLLAEKGRKGQTYEEIILELLERRQNNE